MTLAKIGQKELELKVLVDNELPFKLFGDEVRIRQILVNLMTNAVKYTPQGSVTLSVSGRKCEADKESIILSFSVKDTGIGIKEEDIPKLFEEFERIEEQRNRNIEGTGLGMNITTSLLRMMESHLDVKSIYGQGSEFSFKLKQRIIDSEPIGNLEERIRNQSTEYNYDVAFKAPDSNILVVDDNAINRKVFIHLLKETDIKIDEAESGFECLELVKNKQYDLIFLDHMMPKMDGIETLHHMKEEKDYPCKDTPVIVLTANAISGAKEMYLAEGFDEFLSKPINPDKLEKMIMDMIPNDKITYEKSVDNVVKEKNITTFEEENLPFIDGIDWDYAKMHLPDMESLLNTIKDFYKTVDSEADLLEKYYNLIVLDNFDKNALEEYRIKVHAMKSSAALIGAIPIFGLAKILEYAAKNSQIDTIIKITKTFLIEWRGYKDKLKIISDNEDDNGKKEITDNKIIITFLDLLKNAIEEMDIDASDEAINQLSNYKYEPDVEVLMEELSIAVMNLDSENTKKIIKNIKEKMML